MLVHTKAFHSAAEQHIVSLGRPDYTGSVYLQHPVAALDMAGIESRVDGVMADIVAALQGHGRD